MNILITAGPTREPIDPVRFISNHSSGKMGYALAKAAVKAGHQVTLVSGPVCLPVPEGLAAFVPVETAAQMTDAVLNSFPTAGLTIMCAAVADYRPVKTADFKLKKKNLAMTLELEPTQDILALLGAQKQSGQYLLGFAAETDHLREHAIEKRKKKNLDWIAANIVGLPDRGFSADQNAITLFGVDGSITDFPLTDKDSLAFALLEKILENIG